MRHLIQTIVVSVAIALGLWQLAPATGSATYAAGFRSLVLIPFGVLCPLYAAGCLLHDCLQRKGRSAARLVRRAGVLLALGAGAAVVWLRHG